jgi:hypothetical protein
MTGINTLLSAEVNVTPELAPLWLPSAIDAKLRAEPHCHPGLAKKEERLRVALCKDTLETIRSHQRGRGALVMRRNRQYRGQTENGRAQNTMNALQQKSIAAMERYESSRIALLKLRGEGAWQNELRALTQADLSTPDGVNVFDDTTRSKKITKRPRTGPQAEGHRTVSWIWLNAGSVGDQDSGDVLHEGR